MLDFGFFELLLILALCVLVIGPQDIPKVMVGLGRIMRRMQYVRFAMSRQFDEFMREQEINDLDASVNFEADWRKDSFDEEAQDEGYFQDQNLTPQDRDEDENER